MWLFIHSPGGRCHNQPITSYEIVCAQRGHQATYVYADRVRHVCKQRTLTYPVKTPHRRIYLFEIVLTNMASMVSNESWFWTHLTIFAQMPDGYFIRFTIVNKVLAKTWFIVSTSHVEDTDQGGFKKTYELLNLRALKISPVNKIHIFQCMGKIFCVVFQRDPLKFHTKYLTHTLKDTIFIQHWNFKSS